MTWSKFDDLYDEHEKVEDAWERERATIGLHAMATTHCSRQGSDGVITPRWIKRKLPNAKERTRVLDALVECGLFDLLVAGESRALLDRDGDEVTVGPFAEDRYLVHDYLHHNDSVAKHAKNREWDRRRKELERDRELVAAIRQRDGDRCRYCARLVDWKDRRGPKGGTYDHVTPRGENSLANVVVACRGCNQRKGARTPEDAGMPLLPPGSVGQVDPAAGQVPARSRPASSQLRPALPDPTRPDPTESRKPPRPLASEGSDGPDSLSERRAERARNGSRRRVDLQALAAQEQAEAEARLSAPQAEDREAWGRLAEALRRSMSEATWVQWFESIALVARDGDTLLVRGATGGSEHHARLIRRVGERLGVGVRLATGEEAAAAARMVAIGGAA